MTKIAYIFPGQGSQSVGMFKDLYAANEKARTIFNQANDVLGFDLLKIIFEGPEAELKLTSNAQPAILTASYAHFVTLENQQPSVVAGHSLGEYSALVAAGALDFADALKLVRARGQFMEAAVPQGAGAMAAILGLAKEEIAAVLSQYGTKVQIANDNCPGQIVISGETEAVNAACQALSAAGAKRAIVLQVSGRFHSSYMLPAADKLKDLLFSVMVKDPVIPVVANVTADYVKTGVEIKELLYRQVFSSVLWTQSVEKIVAAGIGEFVEVGPGKVLTGLVKKIIK